MGTGKQALIKFTKRWQQLAYLEAVLYGFGAGSFIFLLTENFSLGIVVFGCIGLLAVFLKHPWKLNLGNTCSYVDAHIENASFSSQLLLQPESDLSSLGKLQRYKVDHQLGERIKKETPPNTLKKTLLTTFILVLIGVLGQQLLIFYGVAADINTTATSNEITFSATDSLAQKTVVPKLTEQLMTITHPAYTRLPKKTTTDPNLSVVLNAEVQWTLTFDSDVSEVVMERMGEKIPLRKNDKEHFLKQSVRESGFYNFSFKGQDGSRYTSELYALEAIPDAPPEIEVEGVPQYSYFEMEHTKRIRFKSTISDDFGIVDVYVVATVSKGSGESVKFREEKLKFEEPITKKRLQMNLTTSIDLDALNMEMGDELYFYVEALDEHEPKPNIMRSETFFAVIKDTVTDQFATEGTLGVDQMPDYFRSQRQLIIDTEKLIKDKPTISVAEFKSRSNELGFDQKALRLKYGQFMGDETETVNEPEGIGMEEAQGNAHNHGEEDNLLEGYTHDHDGDNEHNLVPSQNNGEDEDPLHDYLHDHDDPEASTLFEESLKTKLRKALGIMWDAELHLRLYAPEKSLPYQYEALTLIQEIKNSARIYVHRIGFDPPPIKEERRGTGSTKEVDNYRKKEDIAMEAPYEAMEKAVARLELLIAGKTIFTTSDTSLFTNAGNELARLAIASPGNYLSVLQGLKRIQEPVHRTKPEFEEVQKGLLSALPATKQIPGAKVGITDALNSLFLKEMELYD